MRAITTLSLCLILTSPAESRTRSQTHWGGSDLNVSCATVRAWAPAWRAMSADRRAAISRQFNITPKKRRQAVACLRRR